LIRIVVEIVGFGHQPNNMHRLLNHINRHKDTTGTVYFNVFFILSTVQFILITPLRRYSRPATTMESSHKIKYTGIRTILFLTTLLTISCTQGVAHDYVTPSTTPSPPHAPEMKDEEMSNNGPSVIVVGKLLCI
jgi:hypothetical protein